jgi:hypothetical protein
MQQVRRSSSQSCLLKMIPANMQSRFRLPWPVNPDQPSVTFSRGITAADDGSAFYGLNGRGRFGI